MSQFHVQRRMLRLLAAVVIFLPSILHAQPQRPSLENVRQFGAFGVNLGAATLRRPGEVLGAAALDAGPSADLAALADQVAETRIYLTDEPGVVTVEIAIAGQTRLAELALSPGETLRFADDGRFPDRSRGDGVFTARVRADVTAEFAALSQQLRGSLEILRGQSSARFVRRGPRDIVPIPDAMAQWRAQSPRAFAAFSASAERGSRLVGFRSPLEAARALNIDITRTPFLMLPGPRFDSEARLRFPHLFDVPVITPFPMPAGGSAPIDPMRSLMVVAPEVIEDPSRTFDACTGAGTAGGAWSFGHLMRELAYGTGISPEDFAMQWLATWMNSQETNGWVVKDPDRWARIQSKVIASWQRLSPGGVLNVDFFPARLFAIVNRPDLADKVGYGTAGNSGEGRLVFGLMEKPAAAPCQSLEFTAIFEYGVKGGSCTAVKAWHKRWKNLDSLSVGTPAYNSALELITRSFTEHGTNPSQLPNMSSLNQLRTNELSLGFPWQLREFGLQAGDTSPPAGLLRVATVKQTPDSDLEMTSALHAFLLAEEKNILADRHVVPDRFPTTSDPFLGAKSKADNTAAWGHPPMLVGLTNPAETRRKFALGTCNGCHTAETSTDFTHIGDNGTRQIGKPAFLSGFLTGVDVTLPITGGTHRYADLAERQIAMSDILTRSCLSLLSVRRIPFVH